MTDRLDFKPKDADKLANIPGLRLHGLHATGSVDALAAGRMALGLKSGRVPQVPQVRAASIPRARPYQIEGIVWMIHTLQSYGGCILADEMGLGKTFQSINLLSAASVGRTLILCPGSVRETWRAELDKFIPEGPKGLHSPRDVAILYSGGKEWEWSADAKYVVCSHDYRMIDRCMTLAFGASTPEFLILDEAHRFRGRENKRVDVLRDTCSLIPYRVALTGSPQWNSMKDWWTLLSLILPNKFGSRWDFDKRYAGAKPGVHGGLEYPKKEDKTLTPKLLNSEELKMRLSFYMLGRTKAEVAKDLPPMTVSMRWVKATPEAVKARQKAHMAGKATGGKSAIHDAIVSTLRGKVDEVLALASEARRFVLTTWTNEGARDLHRLLNEAGVPCLIASASMSGPKRAEVIREAERQRCGLVATTDLFAEGLNLQRVASIGILHAIDYVPEKMRQLMARLHRIDIVDPVVWYVVAMENSIDVDIINTNVFKLDNQLLTGAKQTGLRGALRNDKQDAASDAQALSNLYAVMDQGSHEPDDQD